MINARRISRNRKRPGLRPGSLNRPPTIPAIQVNNCHHVNCDKSFPTVNRLIHHYRIHTKTFPYACKGCSYKSCFESNVIKHIRTVHFHLPPTLSEQKAKGIVDKRDPRVLLTVDEKQLQMEQQLLQCAIGFPIKARGRSQKSPNQSGSSVSSDTEEVTDNENENDTADCEPEFLYSVTRPKRNFVCRFNDCGKEYSAMSRLFDHTRTHTEYRPFRCTVAKGAQLCGFKSAKKSNVRRHIRTHHWNLPKTNLEQLKNGIVNDRNPDEFIQCNESLLEKERELILKQMSFNLWIVKEEDQTTLSEEEEEEEEEEERIYGNEESEESESASESENEPHCRQYQKEADTLKNCPCPEKECKKTFRDFWSLRNHMRVHWQNHPYGCSKCAFNSSRSDSVLRHIRTHFKEKEKWAITENSQPFDYLTVDKRMLAKEKVKFAKLLQSIRGREENEEDEEEGDSEGENEEDVDSAMDRLTSSFPCPVEKCSKTFAASKLLGRHLKTHSKSRPFSCSLCLRKSTLKDTLMHHIRKHLKKREEWNIAPARKPEEFLIVNSKLLEKEATRFELTLRDIQEKKEKCKKKRNTEEASEASNETEYTTSNQCPEGFPCPEEQCDKVCLDSGNLRQHMQTHWGFRPYECKLCSSYTSAFKGNSIAHIRSHLKKRKGEYKQPSEYLRINESQRLEEAQQFAKCLQDIYSKRGNVNREEYSELPVEESEANGESETVREEVNPSVGKASGSARWKCPEEQCSKQCRDGFDLRRHLRTHSQIRPYRCSLCHKTFSQRFLAMKHIRAHFQKRERTKWPAIRNASKPGEFLIVDQILLVKEAQQFKDILERVNREEGQSSENENDESEKDEEECEDDADSDFEINQGEPEKHSKSGKHTRQHTGLFPFSCRLCKKAYSSRSSTLRHIQGHLDREATVRNLSDDNIPEDFLTINDAMLAEELQLASHSLSTSAEESESEGEIQEGAAPESQLEATSSGKRACPSPQGGILIPSSSHLRMNLVKKCKVGNTPTVSEEQLASEGWRYLNYLDTQTVQARREESELIEEEVMEDEHEAEKGDAHSEEGNLEEADTLPNTEEDGQFSWRDVELPHSETDYPLQFFDEDEVVMEEEHENNVPNVGDDAGAIDTQSGDAAREQRKENVEGSNTEESKNLPHIERNFDIIDLTNSSSDTDSSAYSSDSCGDEAEKPFSCPTLNCSRVFRLVSELRVHKRSHLGVQPYRCKVGDCNWTAIEERRALRHVRLAHFGLPPTETQQRRIGIKDKRAAKEYVDFDRTQVENESEDDEKAIVTPTQETTVCPVVGCGRKLSHFQNATFFRNHVNAHQGIRPFKCLWPGCLHSATQKTNVIRHIGSKHLDISYLRMDYSQVYDRAQGFVREGPRHACTSSPLCLSTRFTNSVARKRHERTHSSLARFHCSGIQEGVPCQYRKNKWAKVFRHAREVHLKLTRKVTRGEAPNENGSPQGSQFIKVIEDLLDYDSG